MSTFESDEQKLQRLNEALEKGEGQAIEFKESFPEQARDMAKEIASFATRNAATIYLGVTKEGEVVGVEPTEREGLSDRVTGTCHTQVTPSHRVYIDFIEHPNGLVMEITVPEGDEPVYYCGDVPYLRDNALSRPAKADEVKALHEKHFRSKQLPATEPDEEVAEADRATSAFAVQVLLIAAGVLAEWDSAEVRYANPYLRGLQYQLDSLGSDVRSLAQETIVEEFPGVQDLLIRLGDKLAEVGEHIFAIGPEAWSEWLSKGQAAADAAQAIISHLRHAPSVSFADDSKTAILSEVSDLAADVGRQWAEHDHALRTGDLDGLRITLGSIGDKLAKYGHLLELWEDADIVALREKIIDLSAKLRQIETSYYHDPYQTWGDEAAALASEIQADINALD